ncbi:ABC transporter ATP-binding protein [Corynebacterium epidermidicanis]|uniref:ABC-type multidrug transport system, ATPase component n=1 Tax=Corynebacterium epidermidicanis TaxID=1050174 RepID=A0A0G3GRL2_9CORY|nr:ABC transporter ATP-binding protein [Corynebacterium epidermidicanis]AKK03200.1 ABC-type multidrug transport system, ATPase component [Corynebacterium epidermidicanis]
MEAKNTVPTANAPALVLERVTKRFGEKVAVNQLSFEVPAGSVLALLGPNGAGKTTTIEMCEGFQRPTSGRISVLGLDPATQSEQVRSRIGIMLQGSGAYPGIRVLEMLKLIASYSADPHDPEWLLELVGLGEHAKTSYRRLSGGQQQRLSLAAALIGRPELVFLDEPTAGMDAQSRLRVWDIVRQLRTDGVTVILTTHLMDEAEALADNVIIIDKGEIIAQGTPAQLMALSSAERAHIQLETAAELASASFLADLGDAGFTLDAAAFTALRPLHYRLQAAASPELLQAITTAACNQNVLLRHISVDSSSLEDVFLDLTGHEMRS